MIVNVALKNAEIVSLCLIRSNERCHFVVLGGGEWVVSTREENKTFAVS